MKHKMQKGKHILVLFLLIVLTGLSTTCKNPLQDLIAADIAPKYASIIIRLNLDAVQNGSSIIDFGEALIEESVTIDFIIENLGENELQLIDDPPVKIEDASAAFSVTSMPGSRVAAGATTGFTVTFSPAEAGNHIAKVVINSNCEENASYEFSIIGLGLALPQPEIRVTQGAAPIASGGSFDFGSTVKNMSKSYSFVIENTGEGDLNITGTPKIAYSGDDAEDFSTTLLPSTPIPTGGSSSFTVELEAPAAEDISAALIIENNDSDEGTYTINLTAEVTNEPEPEPEMHILQGTTDIPCDTNTETYEYTFDTISLGDSTDIVFSIENRGTADLHLIGGDVVEVTGTGFSDTSQPATTIAPDGISTFTLRFAPASTGTKTAAISIANDDTDENPYTFDVTGTAIDPIIAVDQNSTDIPYSTGSYTFTDTTLGTYQDVEFTISNTGTGDLALDGNPIVGLSGINANQFSISTQPAASIAESESTTFIIRFFPSSFGVKDVDVSIENNDFDKDPFTFSISGECTGPEINILEGATPVADGSGSYTFTGDTRLDTPREIEFTIENNGNEPLVLEGTPKVSITGADADQFNITIQPSSSVAGSGSTTFTLQFAPTTIGSKSATISISNNDYDENTYTFTVDGTAIFTGIQTLGLNEGDPYITADASSLFLIYGRFYVNDAEFARSDDRGATWPSEHQTTIKTSAYPGSVALSGDTLLVSYRNSSNYIYVAKSTDRGANWTTKGLASTWDAGSIGISGNDVYLSYTDGGDDDLKIAQSADLGSSWTIKSITTNTGGLTSLAVSGDDIYITYKWFASDVISFARSTNGGTSWSIPGFNGFGGGVSGTEPSLVLSDGNLYVSYRDPSNTNIALAISTNGGDSWTFKPITAASAGGSSPSLGIYGSSLYVSYCNSIGEDYNLMFAKSTNGGDSWNHTTVDSDGNVGSSNDILVLGDEIYIVYNDSTNDDIKIAKSVDGGVTW